MKAKEQAIQNYISYGEDAGIKQNINKESLGYGEGKLFFKEPKNTSVVTEITNTTATNLYPYFLRGYLYVEEIVISALGDGTNNQTLTIYEGSVGGKVIAKVHIGATGVTRHRFVLRMTFSPTAQLIAKASGSGTISIFVHLLGHEK